MKNQNLIVLGLAAVAVFLILRANAAPAGAGNAAQPRKNPYLDQWPTGPNGEGLF